MINAGDYKHQISIYKEIISEDNAGFKIGTESIVLNTYAKVKTTKGFTLLVNDTDFEKAYTNFTIRYSKEVEDAYNDPKVNRKLFIKFKGKKYKIEYLNNVDEKNVELELQAKVVVK